RSSFRYCETDIMFLPCLQIKLYHPQQSCKGFYGHLPLGTRRRHTADDPLRLGRDTEACAYILLDPRVSHKQLALYAYHIPQSSEMLFTIQNLSQRGKLSVNTSALGYLERMDLPDKANCCDVVTLEFKLAETNLPSLYPVDIKKNSDHNMITATFKVF
uniref:TRAF interacting protein with forkhead associated domain n=1 Tax=Neolamprologus brichardi TaxID=32507 RepID=A0A3Q4G2V7_NEOBR